MVPACWGKVLDAPASALDSKWWSSSDIVTIPPTTPLPAAEARGRTLTTKIHSDQEGTAKARRGGSRVGAKQPKRGPKKKKNTLRNLRASSFFFSNSSSPFPQLLHTTQWDGAHDKSSPSDTSIDGSGWASLLGLCLFAPPQAWKNKSPFCRSPGHPVVGHRPHPVRLRRPGKVGPGDGAAGGGQWGSGQVLFFFSGCSFNFWIYIFLIIIIIF